MSLSSDLMASLAAQLGTDSASDLGGVLNDLRAGAEAVLDEALVGVYLTGSFALGTGDEASDVDFLVVFRGTLSAPQEEAIRDLHRRLPDQPSQWAKHLEGSWVTFDGLRDPVGRHPPWLYVDNGSRTMEWSRHDDTWNARWLLRHAGVPLCGPAPGELVPDVDPRALQAEAVQQADLRARWIQDEPVALWDGWAQPYVVLTHCRLLWAVTFGTVAGKIDAARWAALEVVPGRFRDLLEASIAYRLEPFEPHSNGADPALVNIAGEFIEWATAEIHARATW